MGHLTGPDRARHRRGRSADPEQRDRGGPILDGRGWGFGFSVIDPRTVAGGRPDGCRWSCCFGTVWGNDPGEDLVAILCTQVLSPTDGARETIFWSVAYQALEG